MGEDYPIVVTYVLNKLGIHYPVLLGKGGEGYVFEYLEGQVVKIYTNPYINESMVRAVKEIQRALVKSSLPFALSEIIEIVSEEKSLYTIEKKLGGKPMSKLLMKASVIQRQKMLESYYFAAKELGKVQFNDRPYGNLLKTSYSKNAESWQEYLLKVIDFRTELDKDNLRNNISDIEFKIEKFKDFIKTSMSYENKDFVHGDYFYENVLFNDDFEVTGVLDIGIHAVVGDSKQDLSSLAFRAPKNNFTQDDLDFYTSLVEKNHPDIRKYINFYKLYYAFYYSTATTLQGDVIKTLNDDDVWSMLS